MDPLELATPNGVYRTPGREGDVARIPRPSWQLLLLPLGKAAASVAILVAPLLLFIVLAPGVLHTSSDVRMIPTVDYVENGISVLLLASLVVLGVVIGRRVRPSWGGLRLHTKLLYVAALYLVQGAVVFGAEAAIFYARGGLHLFGPTHLTSMRGPEGRTAHVYSPGGLACGYEVFVSEPHALTSRRTLALSRKTCLEPTPSVKWIDDGKLQLVDASGTPLEAQSSPPFLFGWGGGC